MPGIAAVGLETIIATMAEALCGVHVPGMAAVGLEAIIPAIAEHRHRSMDNAPSNIVGATSAIPTRPT